MSWWTHGFSVAERKKLPANVLIVHLPSVSFRLLFLCACGFPCQYYFIMKAFGRDLGYYLMTLPAKARFFFFIWHRWHVVRWPFPEHILSPGVITSCGDPSHSWTAMGLMRSLILWSWNLSLHLLLWETHLQLDQQTYITAPLIPYPLLKCLEMFSRLQEIVTNPSWWKACATLPDCHFCHLSTQFLF